MHASLGCRRDDQFRGESTLFTGTCSLLIGAVETVVSFVDFQVLLVCLQGLANAAV